MLLAALGPSAGAQAMPAVLLGTWRIERILPTSHTGCWDESRARELVGSTLSYRTRGMRWKGGAVDVPETLTRTLSARKFADEYRFPLAQLGLRADAVTEMDLQHEDADITGATTEVPGDTVLVVGGHPRQIVVSACGVYYVASRLGR